MPACRILVTAEVPHLAGSSWLAVDGTVWIVVSPDADDPCHLIADLVHDAFGGRLPGSLCYHRADDGMLPPSVLGPASEGRGMRAVRPAVDDPAGHRPAARLADDGDGAVHLQRVHEQHRRE